MEPRLLNQTKAAEYLGVSTWTVQSWESKGLLSRVNTPGVFYATDDLDKLTQTRKKEVDNANDDNGDGTDSGVQPD